MIQPGLGRSSASPSCGCGWAARPATTPGSPTSRPAQAEGLRLRLLALAGGATAVAEGGGAGDRRARAPLDPDRPARRLDPPQRLRPPRAGAPGRDRRDGGRVARASRAGLVGSGLVPLLAMLTVDLAAVQQRLRPHRRREPRRAAPARRARRPHRRDDPAGARPGSAHGRAPALAPARLVPARGRRRGPAAGARAKAPSRAGSCAPCSRSAAGSSRRELRRAHPSRHAQRALARAAPRPLGRARCATATSRGAATTASSSRRADGSGASPPGCRSRRCRACAAIEGPVQRRLQLVTIHVDTAGRNVHATLRDRDRAEADGALADLIGSRAPPGELSSASNDAGHDGARPAHEPPEHVGGRGLGQHDPGHDHGAAGPARARRAGRRRA